MTTDSIATSITAFKRKDRIMESSVRNLFFAFALACFPAIAVAQGGCVNSPENPTAVLALVGGAAAGFSAIRSRLKRKV